MIKVSKMSGKLEGLQGINTNPLDNTFCERMSKTESICKYCYSRKMIATYRKSAAKCWSDNGVILSNHIIDNEDIPQVKAEYVRFHAHGELINLIHYANFKKIALAYPEKTFALWSKRADIINDKLNGKKPDNLVLIYSNPCIDKPIEVPEGFDKVFNVFSESNDSINCAGKKCINCLLCYNSSEKIINEVLR